jgi:hypothetical protein
MKCLQHNNIEECISFFNITYVHPNDNRILKLDIDDLVVNRKIKCDLILLKLLIIRLRRQEENENDWNHFKQILEKNLDSILNSKIKPRWLVSFLDTYADHGDEIESRNALIAINFYRNEKFFSTITDYFELNKREVYIHRHQKSLCGMHISGKQDMAEILFKKINKKMQVTPTIWKIFQRIIKDVMKDKESMYSIMSEITKPSLFKDSIYNNLIV